MTRVSLAVAPSLCPESAAEAFLLVLRLSLVDVCGAVSSAPVTSPSLKSYLCWGQRDSLRSQECHILANVLKISSCPNSIHGAEPVAFLSHPEASHGLRN